LCSFKQFCFSGEGRLWILIAFSAPVWKLRRVQSLLEAIPNELARELLIADLDHSPFDVLPVLSRSTVCSALQPLAPHEIDLVLKHHIVPIAWTLNKTTCCVVTERAMSHAAAMGYAVTARIYPWDLRWAIHRCFGAKLLNHAVYSLARKLPWASARTRVTMGQYVLLGLAIISAAIYGAATGTADLLIVFTLLASAFFALVVTLRLYCILPSTSTNSATTHRGENDDWPVYTVLVPLFRETSVLDQLLTALDAIDYPRDLLDIKLILEEDDVEMQRAVAQYNLSQPYDIIVVPSGRPQTKPRALNYALQFARGSLVTIFDSEDIPRPRQLKIAARRFASEGRDLACVQASLVFYNSQENWLTRQFAAEYASLFKVILPALAERGWPLLLGGTSNHFRISALLHVGAWDPFNVTEDADLGLRLARAGYRTGVVNTETFEEANTAFFNWMKQRRRWLKGFLQTWLVHMRNPVRLVHEIGWAGFWVTQCMTIGVFSSALLHPLLLIYTFQSLLPQHLASTLQTETQLWLSGFTFAFLVLGYGTSIIASVVGLRRLKLPVSFVTLVTLPIYWVMMSLAAWMALWDFCVRPFHWHKTQHGLSKLTVKTRGAQDSVLRSDIFNSFRQSRSLTSRRSQGWPTGQE
jgi:glycosyltransferase XagB